MSDRPSDNLGGLDIDLARRIDEVCRRFEADWRQGRQPRIEDYLADVPDEGRAALRAELEALERGLVQSDQAVARSESGPIAEAPTLAPASPLTAPIPGQANPSVHEEATVPPRDEATVDLGSSAAAHPDASEPVRVRYFGDYAIEGELARGGMGVVFRARQISLNRPVALKMILAGQLADETDVKRFHTEAEAAANLDHPGIVPIYEVGQHEGQHYFSMGFVDGQSLSQRLAEGPLPSREAAALMVKVAEAIDYAHRRGVIHRDLKPGNILLDPSGNPRVTDFGLAKKLQGDSGLTGSGQIMGTPSYMPPEQAGGNRGEVGPAADVYALGATLYALVTGRPPFQAANAMDTVLMVVSEEPVSPRRLNPGVPRDVETICLKCLEKEPARRYASAAALVADLRHFLSGEPIAARPVSGAERSWRWCRRNPMVASLAAAVVLAMVTGTVVSTYFGQRAREGEQLALLKAKEARDNLTRANAETDRANQEARRVLEEKQLGDRRLYVAEMNLAQQSWRDSSMDLLGQRLDAQRPKQPADPDLRGFEWYYLDRLRQLDLRTVRGLTAGVNAIAFSPDGRQIATASEDKTVRFWETATGRPGPVLTPDSLSDPVGLAYSADGRMLAIGLRSSVVKLWDMTAGKEVGTVSTGLAGYGTAMALSPNGRTIAILNRGRDVISVCDVPTGNVVRTLDSTSGACSLAFSPDSRTIASALFDGKVVTWDAATGKVVRTIPTQEVGFASVFYSPDGRRLFFLGQETAKVWNASTGRELRTLRQRTQRGYFAIGPDGRTLVSVGQGDRALKINDIATATIKLTDFETGREIQALPGHVRPVHSVAFSPDGRLIASGSADGVVKVWDTRASREVTTLPQGRRVVQRVAFDPNNFPPRMPHEGDFRRVAFSPDGRLVAASGEDVKLWDLATGQQVGALRGHAGQVFGVAFRPDSRQIASAGFDATVRIWNPSTGHEIDTLRGHQGPILSLAYSPDGHRIASAGSDGTVRVWDATSGKEVGTLRGPQAGEVQVTCVAFSLDGRTLAFADIAGRDGSVKLRNPDTWQEIRTMRVHEDFISGLSYSPDGRTLATAEADGAIRLWDLATGEAVLTLHGHADAVRDVTFSPDGRRLASGGRDNSVRLWDLATGQEVFTFRGPEDEVPSVAFSPDGHVLAAASNDGIIRLWDASPLTPEVQALREARSVVEFLSAQKLPAAEVADRIRGDTTISDAVRVRALALAEHAPEKHAE